MVLLLLLPPPSHAAGGAAIPTTRWLSSGMPPCHRQAPLDDQFLPPTFCGAAQSLGSGFVVLRLAVLGEQEVGGR